MATTEKPLIKINLRLRDELRQSLEAAGEVSRRSLNSEIVSRLEESLRADLSLAGDDEGRAEQAWLLRRATHLMNGVSLVYDEPWWKNYRAWYLVFRALWFLFNQYKPEKPAAFEEALTAEGRAEIERWNDGVSVNSHNPAESLRSRRELTIARRILRKDPFIEARLRELESKPSETVPDPKLRAQDMRIWKAAKAEEEAAAKALRMVLPVLELVSDRRRKRSIK